MFRLLMRLIAPNNGTCCQSDFDRAIRANQLQARWADAAAQGLLRSLKETELVGESFRSEVKRKIVKQRGKHGKIA